MTGMQIEEELYSEIDVLTFCSHTPLVLCVSPMRWDFLFLVGAFGFASKLSLHKILTCSPQKLESNGSNGYMP